MREPFLSDIVMEYIKKFPNTAKNTLAKKIYNDSDNKKLFKSVESVRSLIRRIEGTNGDYCRKHISSSLKEQMKEINALRKSLPKGESEKVEDYHLPKSQRRVLMMSDCHLPFQCDEALFAAIEYGKKKDVDTIYLNGDTMDMYQLSRFNKDPRQRDFAYELDLTRNFLKGLRNIFPKANILFKIGNHECYIADTEVLTDKGWVKFYDLTTEHLVAQFDAQKNISFAKPLNYISKMYNGVVHSLESSNSKQVVTDNHLVAYLEKGEILKKTAKDVTLDDITKIPSSYNLNKEDYDISDLKLQLLTWVVCDGTIVDESKYGKKAGNYRIQFKISKQRKIDEIKRILDELEINYTFKECKKTGLNKLQPYYIRIYGHYARSIAAMLNHTKQFPEYFRSLSKRQAIVFYNSLISSDGHLHDGGMCLTTVNKNDADIILDVFSSNGFMCHYNKRSASNSGFENGKEQYHIRVYIGDSQKVSFRKKDSFDYSGMVYCVEMPLGTVVTKINGKIGMGGNCRWENFLKNKAPEILNIEEFKLPVLLKFAELGIQVIEDKQLVHIGELKVLHGHELPLKSGGVNPARAVFLKTGDSVIVGHYHRKSEHVERTLNNKLIKVYSTGCLADLSPGYMPFNNWTHGFAYIEVEKSGSYRVFNHTIIDGVVY